MKTRLLLIILCMLTPYYATAQKQSEFTVLQWNIWQEGTMIEGGYEAIVNEIIRLKPDFVAFSEVRNYNNTRFCDRITKSLQEKGETYYSFYSYDSGLLSRHPITDSLTVFPEKNDHGSIYKLKSRIGNVNVAVYTAHLDYQNDAYYNVRGYDGTTWKEIPTPKRVSEILQINDASMRDDAIQAFIKEAEKDIAEGNVVIIGGDFNEPSHLDWIHSTKDLYEHNGFIVPWTVTLMLDNAGFIDTYRTLYPDVVKYPGFTFPIDNPLVPIDKLTWAPKSDERDRIDYIFYYPHPKVQLKKAILYGPKGSIAYNKRVPNQGKDKFILPKGIWPTDHKGLLVTFKLCK